MFPAGSLVWAQQHDEPPPGRPWIVEDFDQGFYTLKWESADSAWKCRAAPDEVDRAIASFAGVVKVPPQT